MGPKAEGKKKKVIQGIGYKLKDAGVGHQVKDLIETKMQVQYRQKPQHAIIMPTPTDDL